MAWRVFGALVIISIKCLIYLTTRDALERRRVHDELESGVVERTDVLREANRVLTKRGALARWRSG